MNHTRVDPVADNLRRLDDITIAMRIEQIEHLLKFVPLPWYRRELIREYLELTTDPNEAEHANL